MNSISQKIGIDLKEIYKVSEMQCREFRTIFKTSSNYTFDYVNERIDYHNFAYNQELYERYLQNINDKIKDSYFRKQNFHIKKHSYRTILSRYGAVLVKITYYVDKRTNEYVDLFREVMNWKRYDRFDPNLRAFIISKVASNSFANVARILNEKTSNPNYRPTKYISRSTISNVVKNAKFVDLLPTKLKQVEKLYIMADEHYVGAQGNDKVKFMVKLAVVHEGIYYDPYKNRNVVRNKQYFATIDGDIGKMIEDYIYNTYDTNHIEIIHKMADGAKWINKMFDDVTFPGTRSIKSLDKYHFKQALQRLFLDKDMVKLSTGYVLKDWKGFNVLVNFTLSNAVHRSETILRNYDYIKNNRYKIQNLYNHGISCPMESQINYILAKQLTQVNKGFSRTTLEKTLEIIIRDRNKQDLKQLFLYKYYNPNEQTFNRDIINIDKINAKTYTTVSIARDKMRLVERRIA